MKLPHVLTPAVLLGALLLTGCTTAEESQPEGPQKLQVVSTFSVLSDMVEVVGGEHVEVYNLVPVGQDPHEYEATPTDTKALADAEVFFVNGLNLEGGHRGWAARMAEIVEHDAIYVTTQGVEPLYLRAGVQESVNPHAFLDPNVGITMAENIADGLSQADPEHAADYEQNLAVYVDQLQAIDVQYQHDIGDLQADRRVLVTSERAFQYVANRYDLLEGYIWAVDTDELGTPDQIISLIDFVEAHNPPALFLESNVTPKPMQTVAEATGVDIYATVFSDELAPQGHPGDTYLGLLEENLHTIAGGLQQ